MSIYSQSGNCCLYPVCQMHVAQDNQNKETYTLNVTQLEGIMQCSDDHTWTKSWDSSTTTIKTSTVVNVAVTCGEQFVHAINKWP